MRFSRAALSVTRSGGGLGASNTGSSLGWKGQIADIRRDSAALGPLDVARLRYGGADVALQHGGGVRTPLLGTVTAEQIIGVLREHEAGAKTADLARKHGISEATLYNWKAKFGGMDVSEAKRLKQLEDENAKLKKLLAEAHLDIHALKSVFGVKR